MYVLKYESYFYSYLIAISEKCDPSAMKGFTFIFIDMEYLLLIASVLDHFGIFGSCLSHMETTLCSSIDKPVLRLS